MAADHGVAKEGISAFPQEVTLQMLANFTSGGAAINVLAEMQGVEVEVIDLGVSQEADLPGLKKWRIKAGTNNFCHEKAMSREECLRAIMAGIKCSQDAFQQGVRVLSTGEMGIGNTTASSAVMAAFTGYQPSLVVGRGTGLDDEGVSHKEKVVTRALELHQPNPADPLEVLAAVGGVEIAGLCGLILGGAHQGMPVVIDGFISTVAALSAVNLAPAVKEYLLPSHLSEESGHALLLDYLELKPYLNMNMRLGEGTGAVLAMNLLEGAARITVEMATFSGAGISKGSNNSEAVLPAEEESGENGYISGSSRGNHCQ